MRIRILKNTKDFKKGEVIDVSRNVAFGLIDVGTAMLSKDMTPDDYKQAGDNNGSTTQLRTYHVKRR